MHLPPHVDVSDEDLRAIAQRFGLRADRFTRLPERGIFNAIYALGEEYILRVPRDHPAHIDAARREATIVPAVRAASVRTPRLVAFDDTLDLLPVPYTIYERVHGETLDQLNLEPTATPEVWRELGRDLALVHTGVTQNDLAETLGPHPGIPGLADPRSYAEQRAADGYFTHSEERWLVAWLDRLAPLALTPQPARLLHGDSQTTNIMISPQTRDYLAVIDWGSAGWGDMAWDFA